MIVLLLIRKKSGPPIIVLAGLVLMAVGAAVTHHVVTGIIGAGLGPMIEPVDGADDARSCAAGRHR